KSMLEAEEVKIPSWLEPLARNAAAASAAEPLVVKEEPRHEEESVFSGALVTESLGDATPPTAESDAKSTPLFGASLLPDEELGASVATRGSNKGILIGTIAAGLLLAAAGVTWYVRNQGAAPQVNLSPVTPAAVQAAAPNPTQGQNTVQTASV